MGEGFLFFPSCNIVFTPHTPLRFEVVIHRAGALVEADRSSFFLRDREKQQLWSKVAAEEDEIRFNIGQGVAGRCALKCQVLNVPDAYEDPNFNPAIDVKTGYRTRSILAVPLVGADGEALGVIQCINKSDERAFTKEDEDVLLAFASHVAIAAENALDKESEAEGSAQAKQQLERLMGDVQEAKDGMGSLESKVEKRERLLKMASSISASLEEDELLARVVAQSRELVSAERASLFIMAENGKEVYTRVAENAAEIRVPLGRGIVGFCAQSGQTLNIKDAYESDLFNPSFDKRTGFRTRAVLCMPVLTEDKECVAVLQLINTAGEKDPPFFDEDDEILVRTFCSQVASTLRSMQALSRKGSELDASRKERERLQAELAQAKREMDNSLKLLGKDAETKEARALRLAEIGQRLASKKELLSVFFTVMEEAHILLQSDRATLYLVDEEKQELYSIVAEGMQQEIRVAMNAGIVGMCATSRTPVRIDDAYEHPKFSRAYDLKSGYRTRSIICVPVFKVNGQGGGNSNLLGVVQCINRKDESTFSENDEQLLGSLSAHIATAVQNCRAHKAGREEVESAKARLQALQRELEMSRSTKQKGGVWQDVMVHAVAAMYRAEGNELYAEVAGVVRELVGVSRISRREWGGVGWDGGGPIRTYTSHRTLLTNLTTSHPSHRQSLRHFTSSETHSSSTQRQA